MTLSREQIQQRALTAGSSSSWLSFLKSAGVANRVARDVTAYLIDKGVRITPQSRLVEVMESPTYPGTFKVEVHLPGITRIYPGGRVSDERDTQLACEALRAALKPEDLVTSYTHRR